MKPKKINLEQRSPEWKEYRRMKIGGSDTPAIMGKSVYKTPLMLWEEKIEGKETPVNSYMQRGIALEERSLEWVSWKTGIEFSPQVYESSSHPFMMASLDGWSNQGVLCEIKCNGHKNHHLAQMGIIPEDHELQMQHCMQVMECPMAYYISISPESNENMVEGEIIELKRDDLLGGKIISAETSFFRRMIDFEPPEAMDMDLVEIVDPEAFKQAEELRAIRDKMKMLKAQEEMLVEGLKSHCNGKSSRIGDMKLLKIMRKGNIDYGAIECLKNLDLEKYRKAPITSWRIS